jgi:sodium-dependent dicarboxylate transporter 2/3/5
MALFRVVGRIALEILSRVGSRPHALIGGFKSATAFLSMWVSNSAVALLMLPFGLSVIKFNKSANAEDASGDGETAVPGQEAVFGVALMLGIAYAANIGGMATLIGTPPNAIIYGSGRVTVPQKARAGAWLNLVIAVIVTLLAVLLTPLVFGNLVG